MIHVYTGNGKGKTTAALGLAFRAWGQGLRVLIIQFMKKSRDFGEWKAISKYLKEGLEIIQFGTKEFIQKEHLKEIDYQEASHGLEYARNAAEERRYGLIIMDEINCILNYGLIPVSLFHGFIQSFPTDTELVLTGRNCPAEIIERADYVTEMKEIKHPFQKGIKARRGIEY